MQHQYCLTFNECHHWMPGLELESTISIFVDNKMFWSRKKCINDLLRRHFYSRQNKWSRYLQRSQCIKTFKNNSCIMTCSLLVLLFSNRNSLILHNCYKIMYISCIHCEIVKLTNSENYTDNWVKWIQMNVSTIILMEHMLMKNTSSYDAVVKYNDNFWNTISNKWHMT